MIAALEPGIPPDQIFNSPATYYSPIFPGYSKKKGGVHNAGDSEAGIFNMTQATAFSVNTYYVQLEEKVGVPAVVAAARYPRASTRQRSTRRPITPDEGTFTLGTREVSPLEMAGAYATIAAHGTYCKPYAIARSPGRRHGAARSGSQCTQVMDPAIADTGDRDADPRHHRQGRDRQRQRRHRPPCCRQDRHDQLLRRRVVRRLHPRPGRLRSGWATRPAPTTSAAWSTSPSTATPWAHMFGGDLPTMIWHDPSMAARSPAPPVTSSTAAAAPGHADQQRDLRRRAAGGQPVARRRDQRAQQRRACSPSSPPTQVASAACRPARSSRPTRRPGPRCRPAPR